MPAKSRPFGQFDPRFRSAVVEEAQLDALGDFRKYREVGSDSVEGGTEGSMMSWPNAHVGEMVT
jgi:hypothetical protein